MKEPSEKEEELLKLLILLEEKTDRVRLAISEIINFGVGKTHPSSKSTNSNKLRDSLDEFFGAIGILALNHEEFISKNGMGELIAKIQEELEGE